MGNNPLFSTDEWRLIYQAVWDYRRAFSVTINEEPTEDDTDMLDQMSEIIAILAKQC